MILALLCLKLWKHVLWNLTNPSDIEAAGKEALPFRLEEQFVASADGQAVDGAAAKTAGRGYAPIVKTIGRRRGVVTALKQQIQQLYGKSLSTLRTRYAILKNAARRNASRDAAVQDLPRCCAGAWRKDFAKRPAGKWRPYGGGRCTRPLVCLGRAAIPPRRGPSGRACDLRNSSRFGISASVQLPVLC